MGMGRRAGVAGRVGGCTAAQLAGGPGGVPANAFCMVAMVAGTNPAWRTIAKWRRQLGQRRPGALVSKALRAYTRLPGPVMPGACPICPTAAAARPPFAMCASPKPQLPTPKPTTCTSPAPPRPAPDRRAHEPHPPQVRPGGAACGRARGLRLCRPGARQPCAAGRAHAAGGCVSWVGGSVWQACGTWHVACGGLACCMLHVAWGCLAHRPARGGATRACAHMRSSNGGVCTCAH